MATAKITNLVLRDITKERDVQSVTDAVLNLAELGNDQLTIRADVAGSVGRVDFELKRDGVVILKHTEIKSPWHLNGDGKPVDFKDGSYQLTVTPFVASKKVLPGDPTIRKFTVSRAETTGPTSPTTPTGNVAASDRTDANTGPILSRIAGNLLVPKLDAQGIVIENKRITGKLTVDLPDGAVAYLRNCVYDGNSVSFGLDARSNKRGGILICERVLFTNCRDALIIGHNIEIYESILQNSTGDCIKFGNNFRLGAVGRGNILRKAGWNNPDAHADGGQVESPISNLTIEGNNFDMRAGTYDGATYKANSGIFIANPCNNFKINANRIACTNTGIHCWPEGGKGSITNNEIIAKARLNVDSAVLQSGNT